MLTVDRDDAVASDYVERDILVANLKLDELNFRTDEVDSQRAAIRAMIQEQGWGLVRLTEHYIRYGLMPGERLLVIADEEESEEETFIVMEGNRRTTMMKLLQQPSLAAETSIHSAFIELSRQFSKRPQRTLPCVVLPGREAALVWVEVKHSTGMGGAGVEKWGAPATARFGEYVRGKVTRWRATLRYLRDRGIDITQIADGIRSKTTAISRVLNSGAMREELGVRFSQDGAIEFENGNIEAGTHLLLTMMEEMADSSFSTNAVHSFGDRVNYIKGFSSLGVKIANDSDAADGDGNVGAGIGVNSQHSIPDLSIVREEIDYNDHKSRNQLNSQRLGDVDLLSQATSNESSEKSSSEVTAGSDGQESLTQAGLDIQGGRGGSHSPPRQRQTLASRRRAESLHISNTRLNQLYNDARTLQVGNHTAIAAVLIRVFLELSCEHYLSSNHVNVPQTIVRRNGGRATNWHAYGIKLREKIEAALDHADPGRNESAFSEIRRGLGSQDHLHSPENLHDYVHGLKIIPSARDLIIIWDRYHPLFAQIYA